MSAAPVLAAAVEQALRKHAPRLERRAAASWGFELRNGRAVAARARLEGEWLLLATAPVVELGADGGWGLLVRQRRLPGGCRFALAPAAARAHVAAELPLAALPDLGARVAQAWRGLHAGLEPEAEAERQPPPAEEPGPAEDGLAALLAGLESGGWKSARRGAAWRVELESGWAEVTVSGEGVRAAAELVAPADLDALSRRALARFLLRAAAGLRLARAVASAGEEPPSLALEVTVPAAPAAAELEEALSALAAGLPRLRPAAAALADPEFAARCLRVWGAAEDATQTTERS